MRGKGFVFFKGNMIEIRELIGLDKDFIFFNPSKEGGFLIQRSDLVYIQNQDGSFVNINDLDEPFEFVYNGKVIASSKDLKPEVIESILNLWDKKLNHGGNFNEGTNREEIN